MPLGLVENYTTKLLKGELVEESPSPKPFVPVEPCKLLAISIASAGIGALSYNLIPGKIVILFIFSYVMPSLQQSKAKTMKLFS